MQITCVRLEYLKYTTAGKFFVLDRNTLNPTNVCKLFVLDRNTWNDTNVCKLSVLDGNTWYRTVQKLWRNSHKKCRYEFLMIGIL